MLFFLKTENEENVLICLRIIIELHKQFRPPITQEVSVYPDGIYKSVSTGFFFSYCVVYLLSSN